MKVKNAKEIRDMITNHPVENRRIFSIIAHIDHGKSTAADYLLKRAGLISQNRSQQLGPAISMTEEEKQRSITMYTSVVTLNFDIDEQSYLFQFNDTPGHISFTREVSRALRGSDGVIIVVDALEGVKTQTITNIELAIKNERCKPVLFINKIDRLISELELPESKIEKRITELIASVNHLISQNTEKTNLNWKVSYESNSVSIGSAKDGWAFTAEMLKQKNITFWHMLTKYNEANKQWLMQQLPLDEALLRMVVHHCPNPKDAQSMKIPHIWSGDLSSQVGQAMRSCNPQGPLVGIITKVFLDGSSNRITLIGRLFSGTLHPSDTILLRTQNQQARIQRLGIMEITQILNVQNIPAGNLFAFTGPIGSAGETICSPNNSIVPFEQIEYSAEAVVNQVISPVHALDRLKLHELVNSWLLVDPTLTARTDGQMTGIEIGGVDPLQIEVLVSRIAEQMDITVTDPVIIHRETIAHASVELTTKSSNTHNRLTLRISPLDQSIVNTLQSDQFDPTIGTKAIGNLFQEVTNGAWNEKRGRGYWHHNGTNLLLNTSTGVQRLDRIRMSIVQTWTDFTNQATISGEPLYGALFEIIDAVVHSDPAHTGINEIRSMVSAACNLAVLDAVPVILEPVMLVEMQAPQQYAGKLDNVIRSKRGNVLDFEVVDTTAKVQSEIPASEIGDLAEILRNVTSGKGSYGYAFAKFMPLTDYLQEARI